MLCCILVSPMSYGDIFFNAKKCDVDKGEIHFLIRNEGDDAVTIYLDSLPWNYSWNMNYLLCTNTELVGCFRNFKYMLNSAGRKKLIKSNSEISGVVLIDKLIESKNISHDDVSIAYWSYMFSYYVGEERHQRLYSGACAK